MEKFKLMKINSIIIFLITSLIIISINGCDSVDKALVWKQRYDELHEKYVLLEKKYDQAQEELQQLKSNSSRFIKNTKIMLQND